MHLQRASQGRSASFLATADCLCTPRNKLLNKKKKKKIEKIHKTKYSDKKKKIKK